MCRDMRSFSLLGVVLGCLLLWSAGLVSREFRGEDAQDSLHRHRNLPAGHLADATFTLTLEDRDLAAEANLVGPGEAFADTNPFSLQPWKLATEAAIAPYRLTDNRPATLIGIVVLLI